MTGTIVVFLCGLGLGAALAVTLGAIWAINVVASESPQEGDDYD